MTEAHKLREDCIHINVCHVIGEYGTKGCTKSCPEYVSAAKSDAVLDTLDLELQARKSLLESSAMGKSLSERAKGEIVGLEYAREKLRQQTKEREQR